MNDVMIEGGVVKKAAPNPTNWQFSALSANNTKIPRMFSLRSKFPPAYKQMWKNCTSTAVVAADAYYYHDPRGSWVPSATFTYYVQRAMIDKSLTKVDSGTNVENALDAVRKYGVCSATVWPNDMPHNKKPSAAAYADGLKGHEITKYYNIKTLAQIKKAIVKGYPVVSSICWAFRSIDGNTWVFNTPTKAEVKACHTGHAVVIVGYNDETELFEIRNSRGPEWGDHGYGYITYEAMKRCIWFDDTYAVVK